jgi:hypothetical protein
MASFVSLYNASFSVSSPMNPNKLPRQPQTSRFYSQEWKNVQRENQAHQNNFHGPGGDYFSTVASPANHFPGGTSSFETPPHTGMTAHEFAQPMYSNKYGHQTQFTDTDQQGVQFDGYGQPIYFQGYNQPAYVDAYGRPMHPITQDGDELSRQAAHRIFKSGYLNQESDLRSFSDLKNDNYHPYDLSQHNDHQSSSVSHQVNRNTTEDVLDFFPDTTGFEHPNLLDGQDAYYSKPRADVAGSSLQSSRGKGKKKSSHTRAPVEKSDFWTGLQENAGGNKRGSDIYRLAESRFVPEFNARAVQVACRQFMDADILADMYSDDPDRIQRAKAGLRLSRQRNFAPYILDKEIPIELRKEVFSKLVRTLQMDGSHTYYSMKGTTKKELLDIQAAGDDEDKIKELALKYYKLGARKTRKDKA